MAWITRREYLSSRAGEVSRSVLPGKTGGQRPGAAWRITRRMVSLLTRGAAGSQNPAGPLVFEKRAESQNQGSQLPAADLPAVRRKKGFHKHLLGTAGDSHSQIYRRSSADRYISAAGEASGFGGDKWRGEKH